jgi:curved DNA-binding protein CbpA
MDWGKATHYEVLHLTADAPIEVIRASYRKLLQRYHPDKGTVSHADAERITARLNEAWNVLSDPARRAEYDARAKTAAGMAGKNPTGTQLVTTDDLFDAAPVVYDPKKILLKWLPEAIGCVICLAVLGWPFVLLAGLAYLLFRKFVAWVRLTTAAVVAVAAYFALPGLHSANAHQAESAATRSTETSTFASAAEPAAKGSPKTAVELWLQEHSAFLGDPERFRVLQENLTTVNKNSRGLTAIQALDQAYAAAVLTTGYAPTNAIGGDLGEAATVAKASALSRTGSGLSGERRRKTTELACPHGGAYLHGSCCTLTVDTHKDGSVTVRDSVCYLANP